MAFPQTRLPISVELQINGTWTDVSADVRTQGGTDAINIRRGIGQSGGTVADPGTCSLTLDNNSGNYSNRNPLSPYYGFLGRNVPLRVSAAYGTPWLDCPYGVPNRASTPDASALDITGDIDIRIEAELAVWGDGDPTRTVELAGKYVVAGEQRAWLLLLTWEGRMQFRWTPTGASPVAIESDVIAATNGSPLALRVTLDVNNGASGNTVTFYTAPTIAGPWTQLGSPVVGAGTTSIFNSTAPVEVGDVAVLGSANLARKIYKFELRNGINGTVVANPDFTAQAVGATSFTDGAGRTWTVTAGALTNKYLRFIGEVSEWPPTWDTGGKDVTTPIVASGIMQRFNQSRTVLQSTLRRRIPSDPNLVAYWPCEDGAGATQAYSPLTGVSPMAVTGMTFAADGTLAGSAPLPTLGDASSRRATVPSATAGQWHIEFVYKVETAPAGDANAQFIVVNTSVAQWRIGVGATTLHLDVTAPDGTSLVNSAVGPTDFFGSWTRFILTAQQSGGNVNYTLSWVVIGVTHLGVSGSYAGTAGRVTSLTGSYGSNLSGAAFGHFAVFSVASTNIFDDADLAFDGEAAATRLTRLSTEQGAPVSIAARVGDTELVGPQTQDTFLNVVTGAVQADEGLLFEAREYLGLRYRGRASLYNVPSDLDIPYTTSGPQALMAPLRPVDDLQGVRNDSTVTRLNGSSGRHVVTSGPLSTAPPPAGIGTGYDEDVTLNLHSDDQTEPHAGWRTHLGTWDEARFPQVNLELAKNPTLIPVVTRLDTGSRMRITTPLPKWLPSEPIDQMVLGYEENISQFSWRFAFACQPYGPYRVGVVDDFVLGRVGTGGLSKLASAATNNATSLSVAVTGELWRATPDNYPLAITVGGEAMRLESVGVSILNDNPWTDNGIVGWAAMGTTATVAWSATARPDGGTGVMQITPDGTSASGGAIAANRTAVGSITPGASYIACLWAYSPGGWSDLRPAVDWYTSGGTFISSSLGSAFSVPAGQWTFLTQTLVAPATASTGQMRARHGGTPLASASWFVWGIRLTPVAGTQTSPQTFTVTRSVNGVVKPQASGAVIQLANPATVAL